MKNSLCIFIPTFNRYDSLLRLLKYLDYIGFLSNVHVLDSSDDKSRKPKNLIGFIENYKIHIDEFPPEVLPAEKLYRGTKNSSAQYSVICADDDFITYSGIKGGIEFLDRHRDYELVHGKYIAFRVVKDGIGNSRFWWNNRYDPIDIDSDDPISRMTSHLRHYCPTFYALHRTKCLQGSLSKAYGYSSDLRFGELLPSLTSVIKGKLKSLDTFFYAREKPIEKGPSVADLHTFIANGTFTGKYSLFKKSLLDDLRSMSSGSTEIADTAIEEMMSEYLERIKIGSNRSILRNIKERLAKINFLANLNGKIKQHILKSERKCFLLEHPDFDENSNKDLAIIRKYALGATQASFRGNEC